MLSYYINYVNEFFFSSITILFNNIYKHLRQDRGGQIRLHLIHLGQERWIISSLIDSPYLGKKIIEIIHMNLKRGEKKI